MAFLRTKHRGNNTYHYLVKGIRNKDGKVKQKVLKYYGAEAPSEKQLAKDILELGTTIPFDINMRVTKESMRAIIGTVWRNKHTHDLITIAAIRKNPHRSDFEVYDDEDIEVMQKYGMETPFCCPLTWVSYGQKWSRQLEHWYRIDTLKKPGRLEGYRRRVGYCRERVTITRKEYQERKNTPNDKKFSCHTANTNMKKDAWKRATQDLTEAERLLAEFLNGSARRSDIDETNN